MSHYDCKECHRDPVSGHAQDCSRGRAMDRLIRDDACLYDAPLDSAFSAENVEDAEWLWANLPVGVRKFHEMPTHARALVCHVVARFRLRAAASARIKGDKDRGNPVERPQPDQSERIKELEDRLATAREVICRSAYFVEALADNDPDEPIADNGMTVLGKLQYDAPALALSLRATLDAIKEKNGA